MTEDNVKALGVVPKADDPMTALYKQAMGKVEAIRVKLDAKIPRDVITQRDGGQGRKLDYLEGWYVIARMNEIFGQGGWNYTTEEMRLVYQGEVAGKYGNVFSANYVAKVAVTASGITFTDYGYGDGTDKANPGKAHELAVKEAVTDGIKRAAKNFGMSMGLALYDKSRENVGDAEPEVRPEVKPKIGTGNTGGVKINQSPSVSGTSGATPSEAFIAGPIESGSVQSQTSLVSKAKTRDELNALISAAARAAVSKKLYPSQLELKASMKLKFGTDIKEELTNAQAEEFLNLLDVAINGGK